MDSSAFSTALFNYLCLDLDISGLDGSHRFGDWDMPLGLPPGEYAKYSLLRSVFKKSEQEVDDTAEDKTFLAFLTANQACLEWSIPVTEDLAVGYSISYARNYLREWLEPRCGTELVLDMAAIEENARFGSGASAGLVKGYPTQYYFKVGDQPVTATSEFLLSWYEQSVRLNPLCEAANLARKARHGQADGIKGSKLGFVPKSYASRRITVTEPSLNTYFQLGAGRVLEKALKKCIGIDFSCQPERNQRLAREGSSSGAYATIDLKQCSDYISQGLVAYMFPRSAVAWFNTLRSKRVDIPAYGLRSHELHMTGTMGNGFTFPMQTLLLSSVVLGVYKCLDIDISCPSAVTDGNFGVFGDDIVCITKAFPLISKVLKCLGLIVNEEKSFACGSFRESCGADYLDGVNVRGVYIHSYATEQDFLSIFNRLAIWAARHRCPLPHSLKYVASHLKDAKRYVPPDESIVAGVILPVPFEDDRDSWVYSRYVPIVSPYRLETWEFLQVEREYPSSLRSNRRSKWLKSLEEKSSQFDGLNEPAVLKALLYGAIRRGCLVSRLVKPSYRSVISTTPRWGYTESPLYRDFDREQLVLWNSMVLSATTAGASP